MKRGPLSNLEKEYITKNKDILSAADLGIELDKSESIVQKYLDSIDKPKPKSRAGELMGRNKERGVTVMTEASSMEADQHRHTPTMPMKYKNAIHKIKKD